MLSKEEIEQAKENVNKSRQYNKSGIVPKWEDIDTLIQHVKQLESDKQNLIEKLERYAIKTKKEKIPALKTVADMIKYKGYAEGRIKACEEILELVKGEKHE